VCLFLVFGITVTVVVALLFCWLLVVFVIHGEGGDWFVFRRCFIVVFMLVVVIGAGVMVI